MKQDTLVILTNKLKDKLREVAYLNSALAVLQWDQEVFMPKKGAGRRAETMAHLAGLLHERFVQLDGDESLTTLKKALDSNELNDADSVTVREVWRDFEREKKLPNDFVRELTQTASVANAAWVEARSKSDFSLYAPHLTKIVTLKQKEADLVGYTNTPYDALLDTYEPYMPTQKMADVLATLKDFLVPFVKNITNQKAPTDPTLLRGRYSEFLQIEFNKAIAKSMGYDFDAGRLDVSPHPFTTNFHAEDVRITTRYQEDDVMPAILATIHEAGHGLYEQGLLAEHFGTPHGQSISLGIHESQSMIWENQVGRSLAFWRFTYPKLQRCFPKPFKGITLETFYQAINHVEPSLIRVEADEVTYNLHIIIRFEIERGLVEGTIKVNDLPKIWNQKYQDYLGIDVPSDALGVLQDVHWSHGSIGYFPTYSLGKLYAAQFYAAAKKAIPDLEDQFAKGTFAPFREWLREAIHIHGKAYTAESLALKVTGESLNADYFITYLKQKYEAIYKLTD